VREGVVTGVGSTAGDEGTGEGVGNPDKGALPAAGPGKAGEAEGVLVAVPGGRKKLPPLLNAATPYPP
jgi:hypothetical protein